MNIINRVLVAGAMLALGATAVAQDPCVVTDNGTGTVTLPPAGCEYLSPDEVHLIIEGLPPGTTIELDPIHMDFICEYSGDYCSEFLPPGECEGEGGSLGGNFDCFESTLDLTVTGTGDLAGFNRHLSVPISCEVHTGLRNPGDPVQTFANDMFRLQGELFGDPDFCTFKVTGGTDFGLPGPGQTTLTQLPSGDFAVDSFFDITYQIEFEGCLGSQLEDMAGTTTATIHMETTAFEDCEPMADGSACQDVLCPGGTPGVVVSQPPNQVNAYYDDCDFPQVLADDFNLSADQAITAVRFWGAYASGDGTPQNNWTIKLYEDGTAAHLPGAEVYTYTGPGLMAQTGVIMFGLHEWEVTVSLPSPRPVLSVGTWWVAAYTDSAADPNNDWAWETGSLDPTAGIAGSAADGVCPPTFPTAVGDEFAFELVARGEECVPRCVNFNPATGATTVLDCACRPLGDCHVDVPPASRQDPCEVPDNGAGTITLPPAGCEYLSPDEVHMIIDGLPAGTTIELEPIHMDFICGEQPSALCSMGLSPSECEKEGGSLGGHGDCFDSTLDLTVTGTGDLEGFSRYLAVPIFCEVHTGPRTPGDPVQTFPNDMFRLQGELFGDPDFCTFRVKGGSDFGLPGPGATTLTQLPSGDFAVDSFFDITYEIEFEGCPDGQLADLAGTTTATLRMRTPPRQPPTCVGGCPPGTDCVETVTDLADGTVDICCDCVPLDCEPTPDGSACEPVSCPEAGDECEPACVAFDTASGDITVTDCECRAPNECHVDPAGTSRQDPCVVDDNGTGTVTLPPIGCEYLSPDEVHEIIDGLPAGTTIELAPIHMEFICGETPGALCSMGLSPGECEMPGGSLGGHGDCFESTLDLTVTGTGDLAGFNRHLAVPVFCEVHTGPRNPGDAVQTFDNDMYRMQGELFGDPDFCTFRVTGGTDFGLPGPGQTTLTDLGDGTFAVDSFFDITYQIEFEGCPDSVLADMAGTTTATLRMRTLMPTPPTCTGQCASDEECVETVTDLGGGKVEICCDCQPIPCRPLPDGTACEPVVCPEPNDGCQPECMNFDPQTGQVIVTECECLLPDECHVEAMPGTGSRQDPCVVEDNGTGTVTLPPIGCDYLSPDEVHEIIDGLPAGTTIELDPIHMDFICREESGGLCSLLIPPGECEIEGGSLGGHGDCFDSTLDLTVTGTGDLTGFSRHLSVPIFCEVHTGPRNPGDPVQTFANDMYRLQGQLFGDPDFCTFIVTGGTDFGLPGPGQTTLTQLPSGDFAVDSFFDITYRIQFAGCPDSQLADMAGTTTATLRMRTTVAQPPACVGDCLDDDVCVETAGLNPDGTIDVCCECWPFCATLPNPAVCFADTNGDGNVNTVDLGLIQAAFGLTDAESLCKFDVNCNGTIDTIDLGLTEAAYGVCTAASADPCWMD